MDNLKKVKEGFRSFSRECYYFIKPLIPKRAMLAFRRSLAQRKLRSCEGFWPIDPKAATRPAKWVGWPDNKRCALVLTHDVESARGRERCRQIAELEESLGFRSSFNFVAKQYPLNKELSQYLKNNNFEIGVHGLFHKGNLFQSYKKFIEQKEEINRYLSEWQAVGFRSPSMYHNLDWIGELNVEYDASTFDTDPFEPQPEGVGSIFPFWVKSSNNNERKGYVELPYTLPQDHTLFLLFRHKDFFIWKKKLEWIISHGGMALVITHPDYMNFDGACRVDEYPIAIYSNFLKYIREELKGQYWNALPKEVANHFRQQYRVGK
jgi:hypothetical protein